MGIAPSQTLPRWAGEGFEPAPAKRGKEGPTAKQWEEGGSPVT